VLRTKVPSSSTRVTTERACITSYTASGTVALLTLLTCVLTSCTGASGFNSVRHVEESKLRDEPIETVLELLGTPYAYYVRPDGQEQILTYDTYIEQGTLSPAGCLLLMGLAGAGGNCPTGGDVVPQCVALRFGPERRLTKIERPQLIAEPCSTKSDQRFLPATRQPTETILQ
jgi:hypothetical protein